MTSMRSWLNPAIIKENFKRFWPVAGVGFLIWFLAMPFVLLVSDRYNYGTVQAMMNHTNVGTFSMDLCLPIAMALLCFSYLHRSNSAGVMHAMPCTRMSLYLSSWLSGFVLAVVPVILTAAIMILIRKPVMMNGQDILSAACILKWLIEEIIISLFVYSVAVFAGMVAGNTVIHGLTAFAFNFLAPVLTALLMGYGEQYLYGVGMGSLGEYITKLSPYLMVLGEKGLPGRYMIIYSLIALVLAVLGYLLYIIRPLERTGDSYVFKPATWIIGFLIIYILGSLSGFALSFAMGPASYLIGILIGWAAGQMIVNKTTKIFRKDSFAVGLAAIVAIGAVVGCFKADVLGLETYIPGADSVESVSFDCYRLNFDLLNKGRNFSEKEDIEDVMALHGKLLENIDELKHNSNYGTEEETVGVFINYTLKNGRSVRRNMYSVPARYIENSENIRSLWNRNVEKASYDWLLDAPLEDMTIEVDLYDDNPAPNWCMLDYGPSDTGLKDAIRKAAVRDLKENRFDVMIDNTNTIGYLRIEVRTLAPEKTSDYDEYYDGNGYYEYYVEEPETFDYSGNPASASRYLVRSMYCEINKSFDNLLELSDVIRMHANDYYK